MYAVAVLAVSMVPVVAYLAWILYMDRREPEPLGLVLRVVGLGALSALAAAAVELALDFVPAFHGEGLRTAFLVSFFQVAPVEEACKLAVVLLFVWKNPHFNEENDGIVYMGASALGFALLENIGYVAQHGLGTGVLRAFSAVPLHMFTGVILGWHVGQARFAGDAGASKRWLWRGFLVAWLLHGLYDTFALSGGEEASLVLPLVVAIAASGAVFLRRGRALSLLRWGEPARGGAPPVPAPAAEPAVPPASRAPAWMAAAARLLLSAVFLFWALLVLGVTGQGSGAGEALLGGVFLTFIPLGLGLLLEAGYRRRRKRLRVATAG